MKNKNVEIETETSLVTLPKMEFVFDSAKITPARIDKDMIDFEKAEQKVEEIEKLYGVIFTDVKDIKKYREEVASTKSSAEKFKKDLMDYLTADTKEINQKLINLIKRVDAVRKYLHDKEKELDNAKREKIKSIKEFVFKYRPEYLVYLVENKKWENKTFKEDDIEAEMQRQYDELIRKEDFIKQEIEKANKEIKFKIVFESMKYLMQEDYTVISKAINDKMNEIKQTEENLRIRAEEEKQREIAELERKREIEKQEAIAKALREKEQKETDNTQKKDTYIFIKVNGLSKEIALELKQFLEDTNEVDSLLESDSIIWIDWREYDEDVINYFSEKIENKITVKFENNGKEYGDDIVLDYKDKSIKIPYQEEVDRDTTIKWVNEIIRDNFSIRLCALSLGSDTLGFVLLKNENWGNLETLVGKDKLEHYFSPITLETLMFDLEFNVVMDYVQIAEINEDIPFDILISYSSITSKEYELENQKEEGKINLKTYLQLKRELKE